jgi:cell division protein FtsW (lipid II flippase)
MQEGCGGDEMNKHILKYFIDALLFIDMCSIAVIGLLMAFVIPSGQHARGEKSFLWLHRHDWGDIHLYLSLFLLVLLILHLWLNWTWITASTRTFFGKAWKSVLCGFACAWLVVLFLGWLVKLI